MHVKWLQAITNSNVDIEHIIDSIHWVTNLTVWKMSVFGVILVSIFLHSDWIWRDTEYLSLFPYSVRMRENTDHNNIEYGHFLRNVNTIANFTETDFLSVSICNVQTGLLKVSRNNPKLSRIAGNSCLPWTTQPNKALQTSKVMQPYQAIEPDKTAENILSKAKGIATSNIWP